MGLRRDEVSFREVGTNDTSLSTNPEERRGENGKRWRRGGQWEMKGRK